MATSLSDPGFPTMATFFESGSWVWIPDEEEVVLPAKARQAFRLGERATVMLENGTVSET